MALPDDFDPEPTLLNGGVARAIRCWESCRDNNPGGYGGGVVQQIKDWPLSPSRVTACSPFTATAIGMMFHRAQSLERAPVTSSSPAPAEFDPLDSGLATPTYEPQYDAGTRPIPADFYSLHNGNYLSNPEREAPLRRILDGLRQDSPLRVFNARPEPADANRSSGSILLFNLGYLIDPKDMRRGDFVGITWGHWGAHAAFCWDVHLNDRGEVDCFQFLTANSGPGVSVAALTYDKFFDKVDARGVRTWTKRNDPQFVDSPDYVQHGWWACLPGVKARRAGGRAGDVDPATFAAPGVTESNLVDVDRHPTWTPPDGGRMHKYYVRSIKVIRFWGVKPPEREQAQDIPYSTQFRRASELATEEPAPSYATR